MKSEKRSIAFKRINLRSVDNEGKKSIEGLIPYNSPSVPIFGVTEIIDKTAFKKVLAEKSEIRALWNHNDSFVLGNTRTGTLILEDTEEGLLCRCVLPKTSYADDLYEIVSRGDVTTMSFGFYPREWEDNGKIRTLKEVVLDEVSFGVTFPAYPATTSEAQTRSNNKRQKLFKRSIDVEGIDELLAKETLSDDDKARIQGLISDLQGLLGIQETERNAEEEEALEQIEQEVENEMIESIELQEKLDEAIADAEEEQDTGNRNHKGKGVRK
ncbi:MAG: HK97 family phage prohead protease [Treponema sp.]|jgi:HK97 family phage prohead protease|nr:HK97 family phage prohead protease [Treponema sp.]